MRPAAGIFEHGLQACARGLGDNGFVGFDYVDVGSGATEFGGDDVAGDFGADEQDALAFDFVLEGADDGFGDVLFGDEVDWESALVDGFLGGGADGGDAGSGRG